MSLVDTLDKYINNYWLKNCTEGDWLNTDNEYDLLDYNNDCDY